MDKSELTLCYRLATRYVPNQIDSSSLSWGPFFGVDEVHRLGRCFAERTIVRDNPTITREWLVYYVLEILEDRLRYADGLHAHNGAESLPLDDSQLMLFYDEISQWALSFAVQLRPHDPLYDLCEASNSELRALLLSREAPHIAYPLRSLDTPRSMETSRTADTMRSMDASRSMETSRSRVVQEKGRRACFAKARSLLCGVLPRPCAEGSLPAASGHSAKHYGGAPQDAKSPRRGYRTCTVVRWGDLTTNFVRDYERNQLHREVDLCFRRLSNEQAHCGTEHATADAPENRDSLDDLLFCASDQHLHAADCVLIAPGSGTVVTAGRDGIVKLWDGSTGAFRCNFYNAGTAWVVGMFFLHDEDYMLIATTNAQVTVLEFPDGAVVQKYAGCYSVVMACANVTQLSARYTQRYGMRPGACGPHRVPLRIGEPPSAYHKRRHLAYEDAMPRDIPARPVVGFLSPTACWFEPHLGVLFFGTVDGAVGAVDMAADVRPSALLAGASTRPMRLMFALDIHRGAVIGMFYTSYVSSLITAGADGTIHRIPLDLQGNIAGEPRRIADTGKTIRLLHWAPPSKYFITAHVDRRVMLWAIGRHGEPLHRFPPEAQEVISAALHPHHGRIAVLLSDKTIHVYETYGTRPIATIAQPPPEANFTSREPWRVMMERSLHDESGAVAWHPHHTRIICALRAPVLYETVQTALHAMGTRSRAKRMDASNALHDGPSSLETSPARRRRARAAHSNAPSCGDKEDESDADADGFWTSSSASAAPQSTHSGGVVAIALHRVGRELHTFDATTWRTWSVDTGARVRHVNVPQAVRCERLLPNKGHDSSIHHNNSNNNNRNSNNNNGDHGNGRATVSSVVWTSHSAARLLTGGHNGALVTWDPSTGAPVAAEWMGVETGELDSDISVLHTHRNRVVACASRSCRITTMNANVVLPNGAEETRAMITIRVPSLASITACCVLRDTHLCLGTADAHLYFFTLRGGSPLCDCVLSDRSDRSERGCGAVVQLVFLNEQNQSLILAILDSGSMFVYSFAARSILCRMRIVQRFESRISRALYIVEDASLLCGDTLGRVLVYDVGACTTADAVNFRQSFAAKFSFQGATDEITALDAFASHGRRHVIVASLDCHVRLFQYSDAVVSPGDILTPSPCTHTPFQAHYATPSTRPTPTATPNMMTMTTPPTATALWSLPSSLYMRPRGVSGSFIFVGAFGRDLWDLSEPATFSSDPPPLVRATVLEEELLLDAILNDGAISASSPPTAATAESSSTPEPMYDTTQQQQQQQQQQQRVRSPSPLQSSQANQTPRAPLFLTDVKRLSNSLQSQEDIMSSGSVREGGASANLRRIPFSVPQGASTNLRTMSFGSLRSIVRPSRTSLLGGDSVTNSRHSRRPPLSPGQQDDKLSPRTQSPETGEQLQQLQQLQLQQQEQLQQRQEQQRQQEKEEHHGDSEHKNNLSMLAIISRRLGKVNPRGYVHEASEKTADTDTTALEKGRHSRHLSGRMDISDYRTALETRRQLAERMEEYRKRLAARQRGKKNNALLVSARHALTPFVLPKPKIDQHGMVKDWSQSVASDLPVVVSVVSRQAAR